MKGSIFLVSTIVQDQGLLETIYPIPQEDILTKGRAFAFLHYQRKSSFKENISLSLPSKDNCPQSARLYCPNVFIKEEPPIPLQSSTSLGKISLTPPPSKYNEEVLSFLYIPSLNNLSLWFSSSFSIYCWK